MSIIGWILGAVVLVIVIGLIVAWRFSAGVAKKAEQALPPAGRFTAVYGGRIHWVERGEGRPVVMIHGLAGNLHNFTYALTDDLARDHRVIALDRPGCGYSERDSDELARIPNQARMIADFLREEGIEKPLLVGHSLGGAISLALALNHREQVGGLALVAPLVGVQENAPSVFSGIDVSSPAVRSFIANTLAIPASIRNGAKTLEAIFAPDVPPTDFALRGGGVLAMRPRAFYAAATDLQAVPLDMREQAQRYGELDLPVGMFYGEDDRVLSASDQIAALKTGLPEFDLETLPGRGHMPVIVEVERTAAFIRRMAQRLD